MFGFGFDDETKVIQARGDKDGRFKDYTHYVLANRISLLKERLGT